MHDSLINTSEVLALIVVPGKVIWSYCIAGVVLAIGLVTVFVRGEWQKARGLEGLIVFGPLFYAVPLAAFGTEHFTLTPEIASFVPSWIPWHLFWTYFVGMCFIAAPLSIATRIQTRMAASLLALTFFLFVVLMDAPGWAQQPGNRIFLALMLRELSFSGGALALASSLTQRGRRRDLLATAARYFVAIPVVVYAFEQFRHGDHVPGVPLELVTPAYVFGHGIWTYLAALVYAIAGALLLTGKRTRSAAAWLGLTVFFLVLIVYVPIAIKERASFEGINYLGDTLMYCGAVLLLAGAMPHESAPRESTAEQWSPGNYADARAETTSPNALLAAGGLLSFSRSGA